MSAQWRRNGLAERDRLAGTDLAGGGVAMWAVYDLCADELDALLLDVASRRPAEPPTEGEYAMTEWQPIETAPTDGTNVLLFIPNYVGRLGYVIVQGWNLGDDRRGWRSHYAGGIVKPTHFMPIPAPPEVK